MILLIEDNRDHAELATEALQHSLPQVAVEVTATGGMGLARIGQGGCDLVVLDYQLPDGNGLFWLEKILEQEPNLPVVMVTSSGSEKVAVEAFRKGAWDYVAKSIDYVNLLPQAVEQTLEKFQRLRRKQQMERQTIEAKQKLETILGAMADAIVLVDRDLTIREIALGLIPMLCKPAAELVGRSCYQELAGRAEVCPECPVPKVFETGLPTSAIAPRFLDDGSLREALISVYPLKDQEGQVIQAVECIRDITQERRSRRQFDQNHRLSALEGVVADIAQEFKNPLQNIRQGLDRLERELGERGPLAQVLEGIEQGMQTLDTLVGELLDPSQPMSPPRNRRDLRSVIEAALSGQEAALAAQAIRVVRDWAERSYPTPADEVCLGQILANLFSNAIEAMAEGGELRVSLGRQFLQGQPCLTIAVADTGGGIPPENLERIFEPFFTTKETGAGLGLAISRRLVALHQGQIEVRSQVGRGTTVTVLLPLKEQKG